MGVMSGSDIVEAREAGQIVIEPYRPEHVRGASVDVTLGPFFYRMRPPSPTYRPEGGYEPEVYDPYDQDAVDRHFLLYRPLVVKGVTPEPPQIMLAPGERILAHTDEFIGIRYGGTTQMAARSTWGRNGISVCLCAGWGDPGFINRWTMEIQNHNQHHVPLRVGTRIAQIVFHKMDDESVSGYGHSGKYQNHDNVEQLMKTWVPSMMLPRAFED